MSKKEQIASFLDKTYLLRFLFAGTNFYGGNHIRVVNYHATPPDEMTRGGKPAAVFRLLMLLMMGPRLEVKGFA